MPSALVVSTLPSIIRSTDTFQYSSLRSTYHNLAKDCNHFNYLGLCEHTPTTTSFRDYQIPILAGTEFLGPYILFERSCASVVWPNGFRQFSLGEKEDQIPLQYSKGVPQVRRHGTIL
jgi:hypothetical protein